MQMSVDGYMSADTDMDWQVWDWSDPWTWDKRLKRRFNAVFDTLSCILLSRKMAEQGYLDHWERVARDHASEPDYAFARKVVQSREVVLPTSCRTHTGSAPNWPWRHGGGGDRAQAPHRRQHHRLRRGEVRLCTR